MKLEIAGISSNTMYLRKVIESFNEKSDKYKVEISTYDSINEIKYDYSHKKINPDFILFNNTNDANYSFYEILAPINSYEFVGQYQVNTINYLKRDNNLYVLPGLGYLYTECYNADLMKEKNISYPTTIDELKIISSRMKNTDYTPNVSQGGKEFLLSSLIEATVPTYFSTTKGIDFLNKYYIGDAKLEEDSEEFLNMEEAFKDYLSLFRSGFFNIDDYINQNENKALNKFLVDHDTYSIINTPSLNIEEIYGEKGETNFILYPYVGKKADQTYVASLPSFYIGTTKNSIRNKEKKNGIIDFFSYLSSEDGQIDLRNYDLSDTDGTISYIKNFNMEENPIINELLPVLQHGRNYLIDTFISVFDNMVDEIYDYLVANISGNGEHFSSLAKKMNQKMDKIINQSNKSYNVEKGFTFDDNYKKESDLGDFTIDALKNITEVNIALIPSRFINDNIYAGELYDYELDVIFNEMNGQKVRISGEGIKKIISDNIYSSSGENPLISGLRLVKKDTSIEVRTLDNQSIYDDKLYYVFLGDFYYEKYANYIESSNVSESMLDNMRSYLSLYGIVNEGIDGRYQNIY